VADPAVTVKPLHLVVGEEELLVERAVEDVIMTARMAEQSAESYRRRVSDITPPELAELLSPSLFSSARVIVLEAAQDAGADIAAAVSGFAAAPAEGITLVVLHSGGGRSKAAKELPAALRKLGAELVECAKVTRPADREAFVRNEVRRARGRIDAQGVAALIESVGSDLRELSASASQLVADTGGTIDVHAVRRYHNGRAEVTGFAVAEKVVNGDREGAFESLRWAMQLGVPHVLVADALADAVRTVAKVRAVGGGGSPNRMAGELGMPPWKVRKAMSQARGWSNVGLAEAMRVGADVNADVKGVAASPEYALERAVARILEARTLGT
jgi:DNA polymerase-3 subunit delta